MILERLHEMSSQEKLYQYTVTTPHGDVHLTTPHHHSVFDSIEEFLKAHHDTIADAVGVATLVVTTLGVYLSHGRGGQKLK